MPAGATDDTVWLWFADQPKCVEEYLPASGTPTPRAIGVANGPIKDQAEVAFLAPRHHEFSHTRVGDVPRSWSSGAGLAKMLPKHGGCSVC